MYRRSLLKILSALAIAACARNVRRQEPRHRPYPTREVQFRGALGELSGELALPNGPEPFPAVLLLAGSGALDRDETVAGHRPFLVLSDALARAGIASLRYDKRGTGKSAGDFAGATITDFSRDAGAAFDWFAAQPEINAARIAMLGHSEGGLTAPLAARGRDVAALVSMAGPGAPMDRIIRRQSAALAQRSGAGQTELAVLDRALVGAFDALRAAPDAVQAGPGIAAALADLPGPVRRNISGILATPWGHDAIRHDPVAVLAAFPNPMLALFGGADVQVDAIENAAALQRIAVSRPTAAPLEVVVFEGLNHLFQRSQGDAPGEYGRIETTIEPEVLGKIIQFLDGAMGLLH
jgi:alpha-beta hydrolase superfamily lysophospholipase